jgi:hypothetical protein
MHSTVFVKVWKGLTGKSGKTYVVDMTLDRTKKCSGSKQIAMLRFAALLCFALILAATLAAPGSKQSTIVRLILLYSQIFSLILIQYVHVDTGGEVAADHRACCEIQGWSYNIR